MGSYPTSVVMLAGALWLSGCLDSVGRPILPAGDQRAEVMTDRPTDRPTSQRSDLPTDLTAFCVGARPTVVVNRAPPPVLLGITTSWAGPGEAVRFHVAVMPTGGTAESLIVEVQDYFKTGGPTSLDLALTGRVGCTANVSGAGLDHPCWLAAASGDRVLGALTLVGGTLDLCMQAVRGAGHARGSCCDLQEAQIFGPAIPPPK